MFSTVVLAAAIFYSGVAQPLPSMFLVFFFISKMSLSGTEHTRHQSEALLSPGPSPSKAERVPPPRVPSSTTSRIFVFSAAFLRGFLAGGGVYAASGSDHISGYTSL